MEKINFQNKNVKMNPIAFRGKEKVVKKVAESIVSNPVVAGVFLTGAGAGAVGMAQVNMQNKKTDAENNTNVASEKPYESAYNFPDAKSFEDVLAKIDKAEIKEINDYSNTIIFNDDTVRTWHSNGKLHIEKEHNGTTRKWFSNGQMKLEEIPFVSARLWREDGRVLYDYKLPGKELTNSFKKIPYYMTNNVKDDKYAEYYEKYGMPTVTKSKEGITIKFSGKGSSDPDFEFYEDKMGNLKNSSEIIYENGYSIQCIYKDADGNVTRTVDFEYLSEGGYIATVKDNKGNITEIAKYDADDNLVEKIK